MRPATGQPFRHQPVLPYFHVSILPYFHIYDTAASASEREMRARPMT